MVYPNGEFIELAPSQESVDQMAHLDVAAIKSSSWQPVISTVLNSRGPSELTHVVVDGIDYSVAIIKNRSGRRSVVLVDNRSATFLLNNLSRSLLVGFAIALSLVSVLIYRICGQLSRPIDQVGKKLAAMSQGEFGEPLPEEHNDLGRLFSYVNQASQRLQDYLVESNHHAALDAQLVEARRIQADFLIKNLPCTDRLDIACFYEPAYEIGADWYDAILIDGVTFTVVADVCDKGIPSALYMSVFRSLLRLALGNEWETSHNAHQTLAKAMVVVNEYMVGNHGSTGMFATVFVSAYDPSQQEIYYVVAGHEQPLLLQGHQLSHLELGGPAVGIFGGSTFHVHHSRFFAGDLLLAFTDGLPDARSPVGVGFGNHRIVELVNQRSSVEWTPSQLLEKLIEAQNCHRDGAEQFDDLTLLSIQAR
jgi:serine phosphatase RsbU (regulator of sigma subunit)